MPFDPLAQLGAVSRTIDNLEREGKPAKAIVASRLYATDAADLWQALTSPDRLARWFGQVAGDLRPGGHYQVKDNASGTITECVEPRRIALTWEFADTVSWVEATLVPEAGGTRLELRHIAHIDAYWTEYGPGAGGVGWDLGLLGLARHLAEPAAPAPLEAEPGWMEGQAAKDFIRGASAGWAEAAIADGEDADSARAAGERTRRFFSGEAAPG
jgi:uncharacterized protein YndB with AHSA1/START domain